MEIQLGDGEGGLLDHGSFPSMFSLNDILVRERILKLYLLNIFNKLEVSSNVKYGHEEFEGKIYSHVVAEVEPTIDLSRYRESKRFYANTAQKL